MARPRKPTNLLAFTGAFRKDPKRAALRANEPKPNGPLGDPPANFDERLCVLWREYARDSHASVTCRADRLAFASLCILAAKIDDMLKVGGPMAVDEKTILSLERLLRGFGMTPSSRSQVYASIEERTKEDSFAAI